MASPAKDATTAVYLPRQLVEQYAEVARQERRELSELLAMPSALTGWRLWSASSRESAIVSGALYLVTGDHDVLALHPFAGLEIVTVRTFLDISDPSSA